MGPTVSKAKNSSALTVVACFGHEAEQAIAAGALKNEPHPRDARQKERGISLGNRWITVKQREGQCSESHILLVSSPCARQISEH